MKASTVLYALPADLETLDPLRDLLGDLPAVFPTEDDRRIRPLAACRTGVFGQALRQMVAGLTETADRAFPR